MLHRNAGLTALLAAFVTMPAGAGNTQGWKGGGTWGPSTDTGSGRFVNHFVGWLEKP